MYRRWSLPAPRRVVRFGRALVECATSSAARVGRAARWGFAVSVRAVTEWGTAVSRRWLLWRGRARRAPMAFGTIALAFVLSGCLSVQFTSPVSGPLGGVVTLGAKVTDDKNGKLPD